MRRLGVYGGSFNPVHLGHLHVALLAREAAGLDEVLFVPAADPPHKPQGELAPADQRTAMLRAALATEPGSSISRVELDDASLRYTVDTLAALARQHPAAELTFIMGLDSLRDLPTWRHPEELVSRYRVVAVDRPGLTAPEVPPALARGVKLVTGNPLAISSTGIRRRLATGLSVRHLVPPAVNAYLAEHRLYLDP